MSGVIIAPGQVALKRAERDSSINLGQLKHMMQTVELLVILT